MPEHDTVPRTIAAIGLLGIALIHVLELPDAFAAVGYLGALFIAAIVGSLVLSAALTRTDDPRVWTVAGGLAALVLLGYVVSRSVGLPGFTDDTGEWTEPLGLASMVVEGLVVSVSVAVLATRPRAIARPVEAQTRPAPGAGPGAPALG